MKSRKLGNSGIEVPPLCLGGNVFGWTADEAASFRVLDAALDAGANFIDTANTYATWAGKPGISETIIGRWMKERGNRAKIVLATKVGAPMSDTEKGLAPDYVRRSVEDSLRRLQTDYIDLYQSHRDDATVPMADTLATYQELISSGKVRAIGASNFTAERLTEALNLADTRGLPRYECLQPNYNLYDRQDYESALEKVCLERHVGCIPYYSLASGFLTGKYRSEKDLGQSARGGAVKRYLNERGLRILKALDEVAAETKSNPAQVSIAWLMARPSITAPIASATKVEQLNDLVAAMTLELSQQQIEHLNQSSAY